ncbi:CHRD domain-containing protein [Spirosoma validum]|uniref:CHRD domain-containing protein n=1 Tax=Spirosoma validum TaxID=2771355 RepID=A0A927B4H5_9BACT|nr:CHRD domain-containing protein [Spirosoma validum]MBD2755116.1 CHRD domain-containing protein [Spirosoma validum]
MQISKQLLTAVAISMFLASCQDHSGPSIVSRRGIPLTGEQEVPVKNVPGSGTADVVYDKSTHVLSYTLTWSNLTGNATGAHIHGPAPRGVNAPIKHDFFSLISKTTSGTFSNSTVVDGTSLTEDNLLNGQYYFNMHTPANPAGEIRGQIEF